VVGISLLPKGGVEFEDGPAFPRESLVSGRCSAPESYSRLRKEEYVH
jgi:hypothetical protein